MKNPIFVVGLPRTGSTLFENIIARSPDILRLAEMLFLSPWRKDFRYFIRTRVGDLSSDKNIKKMIKLIFSAERIPGIDASFWRFDNIKAVNDPNFQNLLFNKITESNRSLKSIFMILLEEITRENGFNRCCVAFPVYMNHVHELLKWYPKCKIIHVTRDPRGTAISKTNDPSGAAKRIRKHPRLRFFIRKQMILFVIIQYIWVSKIHNKYKGVENYSFFRYEDLLTKPEIIIKKICEFTEIEFVPKMLYPKEGMTSSVTGTKYMGITKKPASHWQDIISPFEKIIITALTKGSMRRFDFDPKNHPVYLDVK